VTLKQADVRKLLYRLGFTEAPNWREDKVREIAREVPERFKADQIPKRYQELYAKLVKFNRTGEYIVWETTKLSEG